MSLKQSLLFAGISGGFYFELIVIFERYASVLGMKENKMINLADAKKETDKSKGQSGTLDRLIVNENMDERQPEAEVGEIELADFNGFWKSGELEEPGLKNINLHVKPGTVLGVTGKIGAGKSGLLGVLLDEMPFYAGRVRKNGKVGYVEQEPVLFSASIKDNIVFGGSYNEGRYQRALADSCLEADIRLFPNRDSTLVGERGVTLSGGQKARLALARALYADPDIFLFDDPISAVDAKVAKKIFSNVVEKHRGSKTIILVTHQISYLFKCDRVIIMDDGRITHNDSPQKLTVELRSL
jgi:ATP-binding cassette subfamily C (CFTR/MRP) protein 4